MKKNGFAMLIVLLMTFLLGVITFGLWYKSSFLFDLAVCREKYYKHYYLTQAVFDFAVKYASRRFDSIIQTDVDFYTQDLSFLFNVIDSKLNEEEKLSNIYSTHVNVSGCRDSLNAILLNVQLMNINNNKKLFSVSCKLKREFIEEEVGDGNKEKKELFTVKNYTLGDIV